RAGATVELDTRLTADEIRARGADTVILATGARPRMDGLQSARPFEPARGVGQGHVLSSRQLLTDGAPRGSATAVVLDTVGHFEAITSAEYLASQGLAVTFVTSLASFAGPAVHGTQRDISALEYLHAGDFCVLVRHHLVEIGASSCVVRPLQGERTRTVPADVVVLVTQNQPNRELYDELMEAGESDVLLVGDGASPRDFQVAMAEGHRVARAIPSRAATAVTS
ncbi:MAG: NADH:flavin oxidoreductase, partial [Patulibacter sp.]|nr:NADH:flavin oxidoreductase [Patulibacter sp.]